VGVSGSRSLRATFGFAACTLRVVPALTTLKARHPG